MITCPSCGKHFKNGTLVCDQDGSPLSPPSQPKAIVAVQQPVATMEIIVEQVGDRELVAGDVPISFTFDLESAGDPPLRIGRKDDTTVPPIVPEVDLLPLLVGLNAERTLSRIQAVIERRDDKPCLRTMSDRHTTYHRRTGAPKARPLMRDVYVELQDYDSIYIGNPKRSHIRLRIRILHP
ncbi:hypothetical protein HZA85_03430 [Candidatus Uhrbacteria bacterium]|nr:hypothetical protein [Candidatus Uhrbacteria bacterium]